MKNVLPFVMCLLLLMNCKAGNNDGNTSPGGGGYRPSRLELPHILNDGMVVQRNSTANFWGKANSGAEITVEASWYDRPVVVTANDQGEWLAGVPTGEAISDPQTVKISDSDGGVWTIENVLVGEVWICAGQSNMEMPMRGFGSVENGNYQPVENYLGELASANIPTFRYYKVKYQIAYEPAFDTKETEWWVSTPTNAREYSAIAYFFGRKLSQELNVPIGIIGSSYGGTRIEAWMSPEALSKFSPDEYKDATEIDPSYEKQFPSVLYYGMVMPVKNYTIRGWLWYQGESNRDNAFSYARLMKEMVAGWRADRGDEIGTIPFYYIQLAPFVSSQGISAAKLREAQMDASSLIPASGIVCAADGGSRETIHSPYKKAPAERLVRWALNKVYGRSDVSPYSPSYKNMEISGDKIIVSFDHAEGLYADGEIEYLEIAGADKVFHEAKGTIVGDRLEVSSASVSNPVAVRYCFDSWHKGRIFNAEGLPLHPFRSDAW